MGTKPVYAMAGLFVASALLSGCRSGPSGGGYDHSPATMGQAPTGYSAPSVASSRSATGMPVATQRPVTPAETTFGAAQPLPNATTYPNAATPSISAASPANPYAGGNAFSSPPAAPTMPSPASYQMQQPQNVQMQAPNLQSADDGMPRMTQPFGANSTPRSFGTPQQGYRTDRIQPLAPGGDQQPQQ